MKNYLLYFVMFLMIVSLPFIGDEEGTRWLWEGQLWIPFTLQFIALFGIGVYLYLEERNKKRADNS